MNKSAFPSRLILLAVLFFIGFSARAQVVLGDAPRAPLDVSGLPGRGPQPMIVTGNFNVDTSSREQVREFYNAVYAASIGTPINSTAVTASCIPGTNSPAFASVTLLRLNWFRALAGVPSLVAFNSAESTEDQAAAVMMSEHGALQHVGNWTGWDCFSSAATNASANSNLALGNDGPDAITSYIWDFGSNNSEVGHRRWILYPQTLVMATGDVPAQGSFNSANATWVFDANLFGPRPATRTPYVTWPPAGFIPYPIVYTQWSFALSNADLSVATVSMTSNGIPMSLTIQPYQTGYGENTIVWYPSGLDPTTETAFPFNGNDTVYTVTIGNVRTTSGTNHFSYNVTLFDPATRGADYVPLVISGPGQPTVNAANAYSCTPASNPNTTSYQWLTAQMTNGNLVDNAQNGTTNFTLSPPLIYPPITNAPDGSGRCFHLTHDAPVPVQFQLNETLFPSNTTTLSFKSLLGYATQTEVALVQASTDGGTTWQDIFAENGSGGSGESSFTPHSISLAPFAGMNTLIRFDYDFNASNYSYYLGADPAVGWCVEAIVVTNAQQLVNFSHSATSSTNFTFTPTQTGSYLLQARGVIFTDFPLDYGTPKQVSAVAGAPLITLQTPLLSGNQVKLSFTVSPNTVAPFHLLQVNQLGAAWTTNNSALLNTNVLGSSYQFTTTQGPGNWFYRVRSP